MQDVLAMIGGEIMHVDSCTDTNNYVAKALERGDYSPGAVIMADFQTGGRGRRNKKWQAERGQNLTFSFALETNFLPGNRLFLISKVVGIALARTLESFGLHKVGVKWPNDMMIGLSKIGGVLIENKGRVNRLTICGIGLNVNQLEFEGLPLATSFAKITGERHDRLQVLKVLIGELNSALQLLLTGRHREIADAYFGYLYGSQAPITLKEGRHIFGARIVGVDNDGALRVVTDKGFEKRYYLDQVKVEYAV